MKTIVSIGVLMSILFFSFSIAQESSRIITLTPEYPHVGDKLTVTYNAAAVNALLKDAKEISALCLAYRGDEDPLLIETPLTQTGTTWTGTFELTDPLARHIALQFVSGETYDDNNRNCWSQFVYGKDDKPVQGAHLSLAEVFQDGGSIFGENKDADRAKEEVAKELGLYPDNPEALMANIRLGIDDAKTPEVIEQFKKTLDTLYGQYKDDDKMVYRLTVLIAMTGDSKKAKEIGDNTVARFPKGYFAELRHVRSLSGEKDLEKAMQVVNSAIENFPAMEVKQKQSLLENIAFRCINEKQYDKAESFLEKMPKPNGVYYNYLARTMIDDGGDLDKASSLAQQASTFNKQLLPADKPSYMRQGEWEDGNKNKLGASLGTHGYALLKMSKFSEAEPVLRDAYETMKGSNPDINERYILVLVNNKKYDEAIATGLECVKQLHDNAKLLDNLKEAYTARDGSDKNYSEVITTRRQAFGDAVAKAAKEHEKEIDKKVKEERTTKPAPDFTLNDMNGTPVTLSALKGKVVIVDFWATWCGPCKQSFPYLQYVYENYQDNDNVKIFAVNTWERIKGDSAIIENAKKFIATYKYTFPVLFDKDAVSNYGVEGIPTKFIIDKKGNIAYSTIGYDGPQMVEEMRREIELLLNE